MLTPFLRLARLAMLATWTTCWVLHCGLSYLGLVRLSLALDLMIIGYTLAVHYLYYLATWHHNQLTIENELHRLQRQIDVRLLLNERLLSPTRSSPDHR